MWKEGDPPVTSSEGVVQGCPKSSAIFAVAYQQELRELDAVLQAVGGAARAGADDVYAMGPAEATLEAVKQFKVKLRARLGLEAQNTKSEVYAPTRDAEAAVRSWLTLQVCAAMENLQAQGRCD